VASATKGRTVVPLSAVARHILQDFQQYRADEVKRLGKSPAAWQKTLDPATFDHKKSWAAFVALVGGKPGEATKDSRVAEIAMLYHLAGQDKPRVVLKGKVAPGSSMPTEATVRLFRKGRPAKARIPYHGMITVKVEAKISDNEYSENGRILWNRIYLKVRTDTGPFRVGWWVLSTTRVWIGLLGGKAPAFKKNQIPLLETSLHDGGKDEGGGIWHCGPADGRSFWVTKRWAKEMVPEGRWKKR
jgi:hypothetical protein